MTLEPIWPRNVPLPIIGVTGEYSSGKTLFGLTIDPKNTLYYDFEKSGACYEALGINRIDVPEELAKRYASRQKKYTAEEVFTWLLTHLDGIERDRYSVIFVDPISDAEDGMTDWVAGRHKEFKYKSRESFQSMKGVFWGKVKSEWKRVLLGELSTKCQSFVFSTHLRQVFKNDKAIPGKFEAKGKSTLREIASLYITLSRQPRKKGDQPPEIPWAEVDKNRLVVTCQEGDAVKVKRVLPPTIPIATPQAIREYILNPPDFDDLKDEEKMVEHDLTEEQRLAMQQEIAEANRAAAEAQKDAAEYSVKAEAARAKALAKLRPVSVDDEEADAEDDNVTEREARQFLRSAHKKAAINRIFRAIEKKLEVDKIVNENAVDSVMKLSRDDFDNFSSHLEKMPT